MLARKIRIVQNIDRLAQIETLTQINTKDFLEAIGLQKLQRGRKLVAALVRPIALSFAKEVAAFDALVGAQGLPAGSKFLLRKFSRRACVAGEENVPLHGPVLIASNHPGVADTVTLFSGTPRRDLKTLAADRPFLRALHNASAALVYVSESETDRMRSIRAIVAELKKGRAILTFPAGKIEPDPRVMPGAMESLANWAESTGLLMRLVPGLRIVPTIVSGVVSAAAQKSWLTRLRRTPKDRERLAAALQIMVPRFRKVDVYLAFGPALTIDDCGGAQADATTMTQVVTSHARQLIEQPPTVWRPI